MSDPHESRPGGGTPQLFITRGQALRIPKGAFKISMSENGQLSASLERLEFHLDMCSIWLRIALDQLALCRSAHDAAVHASTAGNDPELGVQLEAECSAGMLTISAAAFAVDAFYAALKDRSPRVAGISIASGRRRSARYRIIAEALRREFKVSGRGLDNLRTALHQLYRFRDLAVHPSGSFAQPVIKAEVNKAVEWRFVSFGGASAQTAVRAALAILVQMVDRPRNPSAELSTYLDGLRASLADLAQRWRSTYGILLDDDVVPFSAPGANDVKVPEAP